MSVETAGLLAAWFAITVLAFALAGVVRQVRVLTHDRTSPWQARSPRQPAPSGQAVASLALSASADSIVIFVDSGCRTCEAVLDALPDLARSYEDVDFVVVFPAGGRPEQVPGIRTVENRVDLFTDFDIPATPFAALVERAERLREGQPIGSVAAFVDFVRQASERTAA